MKEKILDILKSEPDYISGQELAEKLGVSRTAVWKAVTALKKEGYSISSVPNKGYLLDMGGDILNEREITAEDGFYFEDVLGSTNDTAKRLALDGCKEFFFVTCNWQNAGKGRLGRTWISPYGQNIYLSMVLYPDIEMRDVPQITLAVGLAMAMTIREMTGLDAKIKWPNDIIINGKKAVGILTEMQAEIDRILFVVTGIGVNVNQTEFDAEIKDKATSILLESGVKYKRADIIAKMAQNIKKYYSVFKTGGFGALRDEYKALCINLGRSVSASYRGNTVKGVAEDISENGELLIKTADGLVSVSSGEATVRTADNKYI